MKLWMLQGYFHSFSICKQYNPCYLTSILPKIGKNWGSKLAVYHGVLWHSNIKPTFQVIKLIVCLLCSVHAILKYMPHSSCSQRHLQEDFQSHVFCCLVAVWFFQILSFYWLSICSNFVSHNRGWLLECLTQLLAMFEALPCRFTHRLFGDQK